MNRNNIVARFLPLSRSTLGAAERGKTDTSVGDRSNRKKRRSLEMFYFVVVFRVLSWQLLKIKFSVLFKRKVRARTKREW